jgi:hypothetical protein
MMVRLGLALRVFWRILTGSLPVERVQVWLSEADRGSAPSRDAPSSATAPPQAAAPLDRPAPPAASRSQPRRSDALTLLSALQREARFVDLVQESLTQYSDEQIGAAARDVLRDCRAVIDRMFALQPVLSGEENEMVETPAKLVAGRLRVTGNVSGDPPYRGRLVHHGWEATRCDLPSWAGDGESARVVAPAEIETI